jgi:long-chain acyl-CoA synthetase
VSEVATSGQQTRDPAADRVAALRRGMVLAHWAREQPDVPAIVSDLGDRSFAELNRRANQLARALRRRGLQAGDSIALLCSNRPEFPEVLAAADRAGLRLTPINWHLTEDEAGYIVDDCEARALVADAAFSTVAAGAAERAPRAEVLLAVGGAIAGFDDYEEAVDAEDGEDLDDPVIGTRMLYTSGTTGRPKGVHRPPATAADTAAGVTRSTTTTVASAAAYRAGEDAHLCTGPLYHAAPLAFSLTGPLANGVTVVLMQQWDAEETLRLIERHRITHAHFVPTMFHRLLSLPEDVRRRRDISSLRYAVHGAAPCPVPVKQAIIDWWGPIVYEYYAATEGGAGAFVSSEQWLEHPGTVGRPPRGAISVRDEAGRELPAGEVGTLYLRAPETGRFSYYKDEDKTSGAYAGDYFTLGDVGYLDEDGYLYLTDRSAHLIISGGVNIYPAEIEGVLLSHPAVGDVGVIGVPNDEWGEEVKAVVEPQPDVEPTPELAAELIAHCREHLAGFKCPRSVDFVDELPRHDNGKLYKRALRERYRAGAHRSEPTGGST